MSESLANIRKRPVSEIKESLMDKNIQASRDAGLSLSRESANYGLSIPDFLRLAIDTTATEESIKLKEKGFDGYDMVKLAMNIPTKNDFSNQIMLAQASDVFATYPGAKALFPYVVDDVLRWSTRIDTLMSPANMVAGSRTINGNEMIRQIISEAESDSTKTFQVSELGRIPRRTVKTSDYAVKFYKHGSAYTFSYEFNRRAQLDVFAPFAARIARELELDKLGTCTRIMLEGDGSVNAAAPEVKQIDYDATANNGKLNYEVFKHHLIQQAKKGVIVTSVAGNYDAYEHFTNMFTPNAFATNVPEEMARRNMGPNLMGINGLFGTVEFVLNTHVPEGKLLCFNKSETIEELVEAGSRIEEEERSIMNQAITIAKTENTGYSFIFGDTRSVYDFGTKSKPSGG